MWQKILISFAVFFALSNYSIAQSDIEFFEEYFTLNPKNQVLYQFTGKWKVNIAYYGGNQEEFVQGEMNSSLIYHFRISELNFKLNNPTGLPFEMKYLIGYDGISKKYFLIILNSLTNEIQILKGTYKEKSREFLFNGTTVDTKQKKRIPFTMKFYFERDNKFVIESFSAEPQKEKLISKAVCIKLNVED